MYRFVDSVLPRVFRSHWQSLVHPSLKSLQTDPDSVYEKPEELQQNNAQFSDVRSVDLLLQEHCNPKEKWKNYNGNCWSYHTNPSKALGLIGCGSVIVLGLHINQQYLKYHYGLSKQSLLKYLPFVFPFNRAAIFDSAQKKPVVNTTEEEDLDLKSKQDLDAALQEIKNLAENGLIGVDKFWNGVEAANIGDYCKAIDFWKESAKLGYSKSSFNLGLCYDLGTGVERNIKQAVKYYTEAADQNHSKALFNLAILQMHGEVADGSQGKSNAISLLHTAAKLGLPVAKTWLGVHYIEDCNDVSRAVELFTEAAKHKEPAAKFYLGLCYLKGVGIEQCKEKASSLFAEAAKLGHVKAKEMVGDQSTAEDSESETEFTDNNVYTSSDDENIRGILASDSGSTSSAATERNFLSDVWNRIPSITNQSMSLCEPSSSSSSLLSSSSLYLKNPEKSINESLEEKFNSYVRHAPHCCNSASVCKSNAASFSDFVLCT